MEHRQSLYREIHKGLRALLHDMVETAGRTDFSDGRSLTDLKAVVRDGFTLLESHAHHENAFIGPELERVLPDLASRIGDAHESHEPEMAQLLSTLDAIDAMEDGAPGEGHRFVVALSRFAAELTLHMADEEEVIMPALWEVFTDDELIAIEQRLVASVPPEKMTSYLQWMLPAMNTPERIELLASMRLGAPNGVFEGVRELARTILSPTDDAALTRGLAEAA